MQPKFDRLVILLGEFHLELAFFGAVGTYVADSGLEYIMTESDVLAAGSVNGFLKGKFFNRCERLHQLAAGVLEAKLFEMYVESKADSEENYSLLLAQIRAADFRDTDTVTSISKCPEFTSIMADFENYLHRAMRNEMGENVAYWAIYIYMINRVYRELQRAVRTNDVDLYVKILPCLTDIFYGLNRPNYARWCSLALDKLKSLDPEAVDMLKSGAFSIRRTSKSYCRSPTDKDSGRDCKSRGGISFKRNKSIYQQ